MEAGNKVRKARETGDPDRSKKRKLTAVLEVAAPAEEGTAPPSEAEVEEFFAIVRRMHVAVKYFERTAAGGGGGGNAGGDERGKMWRSALESGEMAAAASAEEIDGAAVERVTKERPDAASAEGSGAFDLNAVPEEGPGDE